MFSTEYRFRVPPHLTKIEIRDYLEKLYNLDVKKVDTSNFDGKKRKFKQFTYRTPAYKVAIVTLRTPKEPIKPDESSEPNEL